MSTQAQATIEGFVTHTPVLKHTKNGKSLCSFTLAVNHYSRDETPPQVSFIDVDTWEKVADLCSEKVKKGKKLLVFGNLRQERWEGTDGKTRSRMKIIGREIRFIEFTPKSENNPEVVGNAQSKNS